MAASTTERARRLISDGFFFGLAFGFFFGMPHHAIVSIDCHASGDSNFTSTAISPKLTISPREE